MNVSDRSSGPESAPLSDGTRPTHVTAVVEVEPVKMKEVSLSHLGPYVLDRELGRGAMGTVYEATHAKLKRKVAIKILPAVFSSQTQRLVRFMREMEAVGRLDHPNIVRATDAGEIDDIHYLAMELVDGVDIHHLVACHERIDFEAAAEIIRQAALGLQHIHENGLVHRDVKPSNLMISTAGVVKILDLGIARLRQEDELSTLTSLNGLMGTPDFMAPEQAHQTGHVDIRADIYSLGCTFYKLLTGKAPFDGPEYGTQVAKIVAHSSEEPTDVEELVKEIPPELAGLVRCMMQKKPDDRQQTPVQVASDLAAWSDATLLEELVCSSIAQRDTGRSCGPVVIRRREEEKPTSSTRNRWWLALATTVAVVVAASAWGVSAQREQTLVASTVGAAGRNDSSSSKRAPSNQQLTADLKAFVAEPLKKVADNTEQIQEASRELAETNREINDNTQRIADTLEDLRDAFQAAMQQGGIVANPRSLGERYHNARVYAQQGKNLQARENFLQLLDAEVRFVDVHQVIQRFLITQEGTAGARAVYAGLPSSSSDLICRWAVALLEEPAVRKQQLAEIIQHDEAFAPAVYDLSRCYSRAQVGSQTISEKRTEKELLERFLRLHDEGHLLVHFLDQSEAAAMLEDASQRLAALSEIDSQTLEQPVTISFAKLPNAWSLVFQVSEPTDEILYRLGEAEEFHSTSGRIASIPLSTAQCQVEVKYVDQRGEEQGPYFVPFDPDAVEVSDAKRRLGNIRQRWVQFGQRGNSDKLYFTNLAIYQPVIDEVLYGLNEDRPTVAHRLPDLLRRETDNISIPLADTVKFVTVQLKFTDGTRSDVVQIDRPAN